ncbi:MAG: UrcA family protein [Steroidobacteraceae bacterium]
MKFPNRLLTSAAALMAVSSAFAAPINPTTGTVQVSYSAEFTRADLQTEVGAKAAYARLRGLARRVCADGEASRNVSMFEIQECTARALDAAVKDLAAPAVEQLHATRFN